MPTSKLKSLNQITGKTISDVVVKELTKGGPMYQIFFVFEDDTTYEIYINDSNWNTEREVGGGTIHNVLGGPDDQIIWENTSDITQKAQDIIPYGDYQPNTLVNQVHRHWFPRDENRTLKYIQKAYMSDLGEDMFRRATRHYEANVNDHPVIKDWWIDERIFTPGFLLVPVHILCAWYRYHRESFSDRQTELNLDNTTYRSRVEERWEYFFEKDFERFWKKLCPKSIILEYYQGEFERIANNVSRKRFYRSPVIDDVISRFTESLSYVFPEADEDRFRDEFRRPYDES